MKGNFHVRFLGECRQGNLPALTRLTCLTRPNSKIENRKFIKNP